MVKSYVATKLSTKKMVYLEMVLFLQKQIHPLLLLLQNLTETKRNVPFIQDAVANLIQKVASSKHIFEDTKKSLKKKRSSNLRGWDKIQLLRKLGSTEREKFCYYILLKSSSDINFDQAVKIFSKIFVENVYFFVHVGSVWIYHKMTWMILLCTQEQ